MKRQSQRLVDDNDEAGHILLPLSNTPLPPQHHDDEESLSTFVNGFTSGERACEHATTDYN